MKPGNFSLGMDFSAEVKDGFGLRDFALVLDLVFAGCLILLLVRSAIAVPDAVVVLADLLDGAFG